MGGQALQKNTNQLDVLVEKIFDKFDTDRSGFLEPRECLKLLDEILKNQGRPPTSWAQFKKFFDEFDDNGDGVISRKECAGFIRRFIAGPVDNRPAARDPIEQLVHKLFAKFDTDRSGFLEPRECLKLLDEILISQGRPQTS